MIIPHWRGTVIHNIVFGFRVLSASIFSFLLIKLYKLYSILRDEKVNNCSEKYI